jgi:hypothetical protein
VASQFQEAPLQQRPAALSVSQPVAGSEAFAVTALTGWGFRLLEPPRLDPLWLTTGSDVGHRGRYLGHLQFALDNAQRDPATAEFVWQQRQRVWSPVTVVNSQVETELSAVLLPVASEPVAAAAKGRICINNDPQAPAFSFWRMCGRQHWLMRWIYGPEQSEDHVDL